MFCMEICNFFVTLFTRVFHFQGCHGDIPPCSFPYLPWTLFNLPVGVAPISRVTKEDDDKLDDLPDDDMVKQE